MVVCAVAAPEQTKRACFVGRRGRQAVEEADEEQRWTGDWKVDSVAIGDVQGSGWVCSVRWQDVADEQA